MWRATCILRRPMAAGDPLPNDIARAILGYLARNPQAQDTLEGVAQWWLLDRMVEREVANIEQTLATLVGMGLLIANDDRTSRRHYRLNPARFEEVIALLAGRKRIIHNEEGESLMPTRIRNRSRHLVTVELNTRETVHLAPGEVSRPLEEYEARDNPQVLKLASRGEIEALEQEDTARPAASPRTKRSRGAQE
jgi:hypothetical protein